MAFYVLLNQENSVINTYAIGVWMDGVVLAGSRVAHNEIEAALKQARKLKYKNASVTLLAGTSLLALTACGGGGSGGIFSAE